MPRHIKVCKVSELPEGDARTVQGDKPIAVFHIGGAYYAIDDSCPHRGGPLSEGAVEGTVVTCPWHQAKFELATGALVTGPGGKSTRAYPVRVNGDDIEVELP